MNHYVHNINPIILSLGPAQVRWYGLMYLLGFTLSFFVLAQRHRKGALAANIDEIQSLITYVMIFMILGSRLVYVTIYNPQYYLENPDEILAIWKGGLSFHGAAIGFVFAVLYFKKNHGYGFFHIMDSVVIVSALGIIFGRIGNFINGELFGRVTNVAWGVVFPQSGPDPRHPSQLYQALTEGLLVFIILMFIESRERKKGYAPPCIVKTDEKIKKYQVEWKRTGVLSCSFLILYGIARFIIEFFREPDAQLGFYFQYISMGQILCMIMIITGLGLLYRVVKNPIPAHYVIRSEEIK